MVIKLNADHSNADEVLAECAALDAVYADAMAPKPYDTDLLALVKAAQAAVKMHEAFKVECDEVKNLAAALEQFEPWLEVEQTPQQMGWVDGQGRP